MEGNAETTAHHQAERLARLVWALAFVVPLLLATLLLGVKSVQASPAPAAVVPLAFEEELEFEEEGEEGEFAEEECEIAEEEAAEGELSQAEANETCREAEEDKGAASSAGKCPIHSATAHASTHHDKLKLTLGYTTNQPVTAKLEIRKGSIKLGTFRRHLGRSGVLRLTEKLGKAHGGRIIVRIQLPSPERAGCPSRRLVLFPR